MAKKISQKDREEARRILAECGIPIGADYYALYSDVVDRLLRHADAEGYEKPCNANASRACYYHERLQRRAVGSAIDAQRALADTIEKVRKIRTNLQRRAGA